VEAVAIGIGSNAKFDLNRQPASLASPLDGSTHRL
jgi:hypothetical protein